MYKFDPQGIDRYNLPDDDYEPYNERFLKRPLKNWESYNLMVRGCLGTGLMLLPEAFRHSGVLIGVLYLVAISIFVTYIYHIIINARIRICKILRVSTLYYSQTMKIGFQTGPGLINLFSPIVGWVVEIICLVNQLNFLSCYLWYLARDLKNALEKWFQHNFPHEYYVLIVGPYLIILLCVTNIKVYASLALLANFCTLAALILFFFSLIEDLPNFTLLPAITTPEEQLLFVIPAFLALQAVPLTSAVELNMLNGRDFLKPYGVLFNTYGTLTIASLIIGVLGTWRFEDKTVVLTENLDVTEWMNAVGVILYFFGTYFTYGLQGLVGAHIIWDHYLVQIISTEHDVVKGIFEYIFRFTLFALIPVFIVTYLKDGLPFFLGVHGFCTAFLSFIFPSLLDLSIRWNTQKYGVCNYIFLRDLLIFVLGIFLLVLSFYQGYRVFEDNPESSW